MGVKISSAYTDLDPSSYTDAAIRLACSLGKDPERENVSFALLHTNFESGVGLRMGQDTYDVVSFNIVPPEVTLREDRTRSYQQGW